MRVRASTLFKAYRDNDVLRRLAYRWWRKGYPAIKIIWDVPRTPENERVVYEVLGFLSWAKGVVEIIMQMHREGEIE